MPVDPNGARLNIGVWGNTSEASQTPTNAALYVVSLNDGGRVEGIFDLQWIAQGNATGQFVDIAYSADAGLTWSNISTNVQAAIGFTTWTSTLFTSSMQGQWRVQSVDDPLVLDTNDVLFALRNDPLKFPVALRMMD